MDGKKRKKNQEEIGQEQLEHLKENQASDILQRPADSCFMEDQLNWNAAAKSVNTETAKQAWECGYWIEVVYVVSTVRKWG